MQKSYLARSEARQDLRATIGGYIGQYLASAALLCVSEAIVSMILKVTRGYQSTLDEGTAACIAVCNVFSEPQATGKLSEAQKQADRR